MDNDSPVAARRLFTKPKLEKEQDDHHHGVEAEERTKVVFIRQENEVLAMDSSKRLRAMLINRTRRFCCCYPILTIRKKKKVDEVTPDHKTDLAAVVAAAAAAGADDSDKSEDGSSRGHRARQQYRLESTVKIRHWTWQSRLASIFCCGLIGNGSHESVGIVPATTRAILPFLHWMFRVNVVVLLFVMCTFFFVMCVIFAALILFVGDIDPHCLRVGSKDLSAFPARFFNAFNLSWTTLGTVGYGAVYPSVGDQITSPSQCFYVAAVCSFEAFTGIIYSGFCGAILFGKVLRIQHHAQVIFSDPIIVQFGQGVEEYGDLEGIGDDYDSDSEWQDHSDLDTLKSKHKIPLPVVEFRIINSLFGEPGGEIVDATLNVVANIDADDVDPSVREALDPAMQWRRALAAITAARSIHSSIKPRSREHSWSQNMDGSRARIRQHSWNTSASRTATSESRSDEDEFFFSSAPELPPSATPSDLRRLRKQQRQSSWSSSASQLSKFFDPFGSMHPVPEAAGQDRTEDFSEHRPVDEDPTSKLVTKRIFSKMHLEASEHPFFKRVWLARHVLDENSPLLKPKVRRQIRRNGGFWPERLNSHEGVRQCLKFNQIVVSLKGVANISATHVFAQKIYDYVDVNVGYRFVNVLYKDSEGHIQVDKDLINDVIQQKGGGGEPLILGFDDV